MTLIAEHYSQDTATYEVAHRIALITTDAFQQDFIRCEFYPPKYNFSAGLPEIADYDKLIEKAKAFRELTLANARSWYLALRSDSHMHAFLFKEPEVDGGSGRDVGLSLWRQPAYVKTGPKKPWYYRLKTWLLSITFNLQDWWVFGFAGNPRNHPGLLKEMQLGQEELDANETPEIVQRLESMSSDELAKIAYPLSYVYYLAQFCVSSSAQGKGYGKLIMDESIARLRQLGIQDPPNLLGPAKIGFFSAPTARGFYQKYGFATAGEWDHAVPSGRILRHTYFFMNLT